MNRKFRALVSLLLIFVMLFSQMSFADPGNGRGKGHENGQGHIRQIEKYEEIDGARIKVNNKNVKFDVPPVIKGNRTLIPVRAITEAMGGHVFWFETVDTYTTVVENNVVIETTEISKDVAVIFSPDWTKAIIFFLNPDYHGGNTFVYRELDVFEEPVTLEDVEDWIVGLKFETPEVLDAPPGLINNRTFVPLRFIAETFELKVGYDNDTGEITIDSEPEFDPEKLVFEVLSDLDEQDNRQVLVELNDFEFVDVEGLSLGIHYIVTTHDLDVTVPEGHILVEFLKATLLGLTEEETEFTFNFKKDEVPLALDFEVQLKYYEELPVILTEGLSFTEEPDPDAVHFVEMEFNDYVLEKVRYREAKNVEIAFNMIAGYEIGYFEKGFINSLTLEETVLEFVFVHKDDSSQEVVLEFTIELAYNAPVVTE